LEKGVDDRSPGGQVDSRAAGAILAANTGPLVALNGLEGGIDGCRVDRAGRWGRGLLRGAGFGECIAAVPSPQPAVGGLLLNLRDDPHRRDRDAHPPPDGPGGGGGPGAPWWNWIGGPMGALIVLSGAALAPRLGAAAFIAAVVGGQLACSLVLDHFGLMDLPRQVVTPGRLLGVLLVFAGVVLVKFH